MTGTRKYGEHLTLTSIFGDIEDRLDKLEAAADPDTEPAAHAALWREIALAAQVELADLRDAINTIHQEYIKMYLGEARSYCTNCKTGWPCRTATAANPTKATQ